MSIKFRATRLGMPLSHNYGKWYAKMVPIGNITSEQLAEEVSHLSTVTRSDMLAVLWSLAAVIRRHLLNPTASFSKRALPSATGERATSRASSYGARSYRASTRPP